MNDKAPCKSRNLFSCINIDDSGKNTSDNDIIGSAQSHKQYFHISLFGYQDTGGLRKYNLEDRYEKIAQITVWEHV